MPSRSKLSLAVGVCAPVLAGCSLLYNPSNLPQPTAEAGVDTPTDMEIILDTNPAALSVESVYPATISEGTGDGGSPAGLLVVNGMQFVQAIDTTVTIAAHDGTSDISKITVDNSKLKVAADGRQLVVPITSLVDTDPAHGKGAMVALDVSVTQANGAGGHVTMKVPGDTALTILYLDELTEANLSSGKLATGVHEYSKVAITTGGLKPADANGPLVIRSHSSIAIAGAVDVSATGVTAGPGGAGGGNGGAGGGLGNGDPGGMGGGAGGGKPSSAGGGLGTAGGDGNATSTGGGPVGNPSIPALAAPQQGAGGSGGKGGNVLGATGGAGGAGGGTVELTAAGTLMVDTVTSKGGGGTGGNATGGSGSGGVILLRGGKSVAASALTITGAVGGSGFGKGGDGLLRIDQPALPDVTATAQYHGPTLMSYPQITDVATPMVTVVGTKQAAFSYYYIDDQGAIAGPFSKTVGTTGSVMFNLSALSRGINHVCMLVDGGTTQSPPEATNCVDVAYMYKP